MKAGEKDCQTCQHVLGGKMEGGKILTTERCKLHKSGPHLLHTWTATHRASLCGPDLKNWTPKATP